MARHIKSVWWVGAGAVLLVGAGIRAADTAPFDAAIDAKIETPLLQAMSTAGDGEKLPVIVIMREQASRQAIDEASGIADKAARRQAVIGLLKEVAGRTQPDLLAYLDQKVADGQASGVDPLWLHNLVGADVTPAVVWELAARGDVALLHLESILGPEVFPVEPGQGEPPIRAEIECGVNIMGAPRVWDELQITGQGSVVAVIDTGACITHSDLQNQIWINEDEIPNNNIDDDNNGFIDDINGWNFENNNKDVNDVNGHGTHVSGTVGGDGTGGTQTGMAPNVQLMITKFWNNFGGEQSVWSSMEYAADNGADVTTASLGWPYSQNPQRVIWRNTCENTMAAGLAVVYAAGNEGGGNPPNNVRCPGDVPDVITVGATDCNDNIAGFSSRGPVTWQNIAPFNDWPYPPGKLKPTISAPGVDTKSCRICSGYTNLSGTSMATPHVAGAIALMLEAGPDLSHFEVKQILKDTAKDLGAPGPDNDYGAGRVQAFEAVLESMSEPIPAACCFDNGDCENLLRTDCTDRGGRFNFGEECDAFQCPLPGACCITNSDCEVLLLRDCVARGGDFLGEGESCFRACPCDKIKKMKANCKGSGTIKVQVVFRDESFNGQTVKIGVGERLRFDVEVHGKKAVLYTCCFNGPQEIVLLEPEGCLDPKVVDCPE